MGTEQARELIAKAGRIVVLSGAGISTDSGIPDFRGPDGLWTKNPDAQRMSNLREYQRDPALRAQTWLARRVHPAWTAEPNAAHLALVRLERGGRLAAIVTQNIDRLHQRAGSSRVIELHGTIFDTVCLSCAEVRPMREALERVAAGEVDPPCLRCGGILKSATVSFGQALDRAVLDEARAVVESADLLMAVGSSLTVQPAAGLVGLAARAGAVVVLCNASPTPYDGMASAVVRGSLSVVLPELV
ncbi:NAD-dependent deacetylase [Actinokineospora alba]|uniref:protein acetyllysine N-acetyltransferase n=1 Tax=Actinokineospora alba TaxID=504798 RepID=A0A1H0JAR5_9PSEU|nr:NAD-dependent deacylase [Actinokineospora alba]TDP68365.1 NAD-dependent deacetylase [Actinokineospora alba]SDH77552.1 NAD-dependent deacetylase [Actinokineospora alba]SDO40766.1 NAD-dependent deacetylase [Actinokineospora alba]